MWYILLYLYPCALTSSSNISFSNMFAIHPIATLGRFATHFIVVSLDKFARLLFGRAFLLVLHFLATAGLVLFRGAFRLSVGQCWTCWTCCCIGHLIHSFPIQYFAPSFRHVVPTTVQTIAQLFPCNQYLINVPGTTQSLSSSSPPRTACRRFCNATRANIGDDDKLPINPPPPPPRAIFFPATAALLLFFVSI